jgi:zinc transport system ATP-binding protein
MVDTRSMKSPAPKPPAVRLAGVTFGYPPEPWRQPVVSEIDLVVERDDFLGLIGPNGGGKTTLLKLILGLLTPQRGTVEIFGQPPRGAVRRKIGYVPQLAQVDATVPADVLDVVLTGRLGHSSWGPRYRRQDRDAALAALAQVEAEELARQPLAALSGGQRQRVLIARALASDAEMLLLDEPTAGVDARRERRFLELLLRLNERLPIVLVSHDIGFVSAHLKHVACLNQSLSIHAGGELTDAAVEAMYHTPVLALHPHGFEGSHSHHHGPADSERADTAPAEPASESGGR